MNGAVETLEEQGLRIARLAQEEADGEWGRAALSEEVARRRVMAAQAALEAAIADASKARSRAESARGVLATRLAALP